MNSYIADKKVLTVSVLEDRKSPNGSEMVKVSFKDGTEEIMPKLRFELIVTSEISDLSGVQKLVREKVGSTMFSILHEYGIKFGEIEGAVDACVNYANAGLQKATDILFGYPQSNLPLIEINNILIKNAKESSDGATPTGSGPDKQDQE